MLHLPSDETFMQRCLTLAATAAGYTAPNPMVGSVVVRDGEIVGEGYHPEAGQPHAEVFALKAAGDRARGATLYVNLEPCNHTGRTPPCTEAILAAGIQRVVIGMIDPDPRVSGGGVARLQQAGIAVTTGVAEADCQRLNEAFGHRVRQRRPFGILKYAMTLDGKIAASSGHSAWVTGTAARTAVHRLRGRSDAVIVGGNTVRQDNPHLTPHGHHDRPPLRVVMSRTLVLPENAHLWNQNEAPTLVFCGPDADRARARQLQDQGVEVVRLDELTPPAVFDHLYDRGHLQVLWECGGSLAARAIAHGCVQRIWAFIAPKLIGGASAPVPVGELGLTRMDQALQLQNVVLQQVGADYLLQGDLADKSHLSLE